MPKAGLLELVDGETGEPMVVDTGDEGWRRFFAQSAAQRQQNLESLCRRHEIDLMQLATDAPFDGELVKFFRQRSRRLAHH